MIITDIEKIGRYRYLVRFEDGCRCVFDEKQIREMNIEEGKDMSLEDRDKYFKDVLLPRAKEYILRTLTSSDKTVAQLKTGLKRKYMPDVIIEEAVECIDRYGYIDDVRFAVNYIESRKNSKSREYIRHSLSSKGIDPQVIAELMQDYDKELEIPLIEKKIISFFKGKKEISRKDMDKLAASLLRQGFDQTNVYNCVYNKDIVKNM